MAKTRIIRIDDCASCPLSTFKLVRERKRGGIVICESGPLRQKLEVGIFEEVVDKKIIPDWCPLELLEEASNGFISEIPSTPLC